MVRISVALTGGLFMNQEREYALAGVDPRLIDPFKRLMSEVGKKTLAFPTRRGVHVGQGAHGAVFSYNGGEPHLWCKTQEGLGNKNWIAEWMYQFAGTGEPYYEGIGIDTALMAVNDVSAQGAMPVVYTDEVAAGDSEWFRHERKPRDLARGFFRVCEDVGMALPAGESPSLRYLIRSEPPVESAPSLSGCVTGIIAPTSRLITGNKLKVGDAIIGAPSTGLHANGATLVIKRGLALPPDYFLTRLPNGKTFGEEALIPTRSYVRLVEALLDAGVQIHKILPGTGGGVSKIAVDRRAFTYRIHTWVEVPTLFQFMREIGVTLMDCLTTFNWGVGYYVFVPFWEVGRTIQVGRRAGYNLVEVGRVEEGDRQVIFEPEGGIKLPPPGE